MANQNAISANSTTPLPLASGGSNASLTADNGAVVYSSGTAMALLASTATAGKVLQSGSSAAPSWSTPTYPSSSGTLGKILASDGTNIVYTTSTFPVTAGGAGTIIRSNGTNWIASTATFADLYTANNLLYASGSNTVTGLATGNYGILNTGATGVPSITSSPVISASLTIGVASTATGALNMVGTTSGAVTVKSADAAGTWTLTLPTTGGTNNYALTTNGSGTSTWSAVVNSVTGTANQVNVSASTGAVTLSTPQDIATSSSPTFASLTLNSASDTTIMYKESSADRWSTSYSVAGNYFYLRDTQNSRDMLTLFDNGTSEFNQGHVGIGSTNDGTKSLVVTANTADVYGIQLLGTRTAVDGSSNTFSIITGGTFNPTSGSTTAFSFSANPTFISPTAQTMVNSGSYYCYNNVSSNVATISNLFGMFIDTGSAGAGTVSTSYGLWCRQQTAGSNRYGAYFEDKVGIATTTPTHTLELGNDDAAKTTTTLWTVTSDVAVKQNIRELSDATSKIRQLIPRVYTYTDDFVSKNPGSIEANKDYYGLVANEVEPIFPDCVKSVEKRYVEQDEKGVVLKEETVTLKTLNMHNILISMIKSIQEIDERIVELENQILAVRIP